MPSHSYAVALGSNQGDRLAALKHARDRLFSGAVSRPGSGLASAVYQTAPVGCPPGSPPFLNAVVAFESLLTPHALLAFTQECERDAGRPPVGERGHHAPRTIDIDLLHAGDLAVSSAGLVLPHPRLHLRRFVLQPLAEVEPGRVLPGFDVPVGTLLDRLQCDGPPLTLVSAADRW